MYKYIITCILHVHVHVHYVYTCTCTCTCSACRFIHVCTCTFVHFTCTCTCVLYSTYWTRVTSWWWEWWGDKVWVRAASCPYWQGAARGRASQPCSALRRGRCGRVRATRPLGWTWPSPLRGSFCWTHRYNYCMYV